jgi:hypothetical protein
MQGAIAEEPEAAASAVKNIYKAVHTPGVAA